MGTGGEHWGQGTDNPVVALAAVLSLPRTHTLTRLPPSVSQLWVINESLPLFSHQAPAMVALTFNAQIKKCRSWGLTPEGLT